MNLLGIILISIGLSLDVCAVTICKGAVIGQWKKRKMLLMGAIFTLWQVLALNLGNLVRYVPAIKHMTSQIQTAWVVISTLVFIGLGAYMIYKAIKNVPVNEHREDELNWKQITVLTVLTSIDSAVAGVGYAMFGITLALVSVVLAIMTIASSVIGAWIGYRLGADRKGAIYATGGAVLIVAAIETMVSMLF